jgi:hypothetical protein
MITTNYLSTSIPFFLLKNCKIIRFPVEIKFLIDYAYPVMKISKSITIQGRNQYE